MKAVPILLDFSEKRRPNQSINLKVNYSSLLSRGYNEHRKCAVFLAPFLSNFEAMPQKYF